MLDGGDPAKARLTTSAIGAGTLGSVQTVDATAAVTANGDATIAAPTGCLGAADVVSAVRSVAPPRQGGAATAPSASTPPSGMGVVATLAAAAPRSAPTVDAAPATV